MSCYHFTWSYTRHITNIWEDKSICVLTIGVTSDHYRRAVRADTAIDFLCPPCESAVAAQPQQPQDDSLETGFQPPPQFESTRLSVSANANNSQRSVSFDVDITVDQHQRTEEESLDIDAIARADDDTPTDGGTSDEPQFRVVPGASKRGHDLLLDNTGYSYNVSKRWSLYYYIAGSMSSRVS